MANNPDAAPVLDAMRKRYDAELDEWKQEAVPYNKYQQHGERFDRTIPWEKKGSKTQRDTKTADEE